MSILDIFKKKPKEPKLREGYKIFVNNGRWGDTIHFIARRENGVECIGGHTWPRPENGDGLILDMESGKKMLYLLEEVRHCSDPNDMWFATAHPLKYVDDQEIEALMAKKNDLDKQMTKYPL